ncbi:BRO family protein, partial [Pasteurella multocida]
MTTLSFQNTSLSVINQNNQIWFSALDIGKALGYSNGDIGVKNIYNRHQDEFTPCMTALIDTQTNGDIQKMRIFSLRGTHLIGMLSHTKVAKDFRKWVLDILDRETNQPQQLALPEPEKKYTFSFTEYELQQLAWAWFAFSRC